MGFRWNTRCNEGLLLEGFVEKRSAEVLLPLVDRFIAPGSIIYSDEWRAYRGISALPVQSQFEHYTVNHSQNFVNRVNGVHSREIECV